MHNILRKKILWYLLQKMENIFCEEKSRDLLYWTFNSYITGIAYSKTQT